VEDTVTLLDQFEDLLRTVAAGRAPIAAVESWYQLNVEALQSSESAPLKSAVPRALVYTWSWRTGGSGDQEARAALEVLVGRVQPAGR
jgi:hypothetical protein